MKNIFSGEFEYNTPNNTMSPPGKCHLIIAKDDLRTFVLATELDNNPGASITNCIETLIKQVKTHFNLEKIEWFECYPHHPNPAIKYTKWDGETWKPTNEREREILNVMGS